MEQGDAIPIRLRLRGVGKLFGDRQAADYFRYGMIPLSKKERKQLPRPGRGCRPEYLIEFTYDAKAAERDAAYDGYSALVTAAWFGAMRKADEEDRMVSRGGDQQGPLRTLVAADDRSGVVAAGGRLRPPMLAELDAGFRIGGRTGGRAVALAERCRDRNDGS